MAHITPVCYIKQVSAVVNHHESVCCCRRVAMISFLSLYTTTTNIQFFSFVCMYSIIKEKTGYTQLLCLFSKIVVAVSHEYIVFGVGFMLMQKKDICYTTSTRSSWYMNCYLLIYS